MAKKRRNQIIDLKVVPGEPLDGSGRVCIHLFVKDDRGPFVEPHVLCPKKDGVSIARGDIEAKPARGRLACDPKRTVAPVTRGSIVTVTPRTDDPRAVTCPKCLASPECAELLKIIEGAPAQ